VLRGRGLRRLPVVRAVPTTRRTTSKLLCMNKGFGTHMGTCWETRVYLVYRTLSDQMHFVTTRESWLEVDAGGAQAWAADTFCRDCLLITYPPTSLHGLSRQTCVTISLRCFCSCYKSARFPMCDTATILLQIWTPFPTTYPNRCFAIALNLSSASSSFHLERTCP
jgi:hypothetical protein